MFVCYNVILRAKFPDCTKYFEFLGSKKPQIKQEIIHIYLIWPEVTALTDAGFHKMES